MALKSTIFKAEVAISDLNRHYYHSHRLTLARHPSETDERLLVRILAFILNADDNLHFGKGISNEEEAALWQHHYNGDCQLWIEVGQPDERRLRKACNQSQQVRVYAYGESGVRQWLPSLKNHLSRFDNLQIWLFPDEQLNQLSHQLERTQHWSCTLEGEQLWVADVANQYEFTPVRLWPEQR
ncbi:YaeQ family protein [Balneatrix alpica]|uniref:YaeQ family protein n=1 Tax=Balneatrix alpica TaxID=75684 RepID=UPI00273865D3|nr:YaeQ family protein [Balneatrix alpica]